TPPGLRHNETSQKRVRTEKLREAFYNPAQLAALNRPRRPSTTPRRLHLQHIHQILAPRGQLHPALIRIYKRIRLVRHSPILTPPRRPVHLTPLPSANYYHCSSHQTNVRLNQKCRFPTLTLWPSARLARTFGFG